MTPTPADWPPAARTCTSPGATESRMLAWLSAPVPLSSSMNILFFDGGLGITDEAEAEPDNPPTAAIMPNATSATAAAAPIPAVSLRRHRHQPWPGSVPVGRSAAVACPAAVGSPGAGATSLAWIPGSPG